MGTFRWPSILCVSAFLSLAAAAQGQPIPEDFHIVARYGPGYSDWRSWKVTINSSGEVSQQVGTGGRGGGEPYDKKLKFTKEEMAGLLAKVKEADFFNIREKFKPKVTDQNTLFLDITLAKKSHAVSVYGYALIRDKDEQAEADRFLKIWVEILKKVPSPNNEDLNRYKAGFRVKVVPMGPADPRLLRTMDADPVHGIAYSPDGKTLAAGHRFRGVSIWESASGRYIDQLAKSKSTFYSAAFTPDGKKLAAGGDFVLLWDTAARKQIPNPQQQRSTPARAIVFHPNGKTLALAYGTTVELWEAGTDSRPIVLVGHEQQVTSLAFSADGKQLASGSTDRTIRLWDAAAGKPIRTIADAGSVRGLAYSPDGKMLASAADEFVLRDPSTGEKIRSLRGHTDLTTAVAFSPDGKTLASASADKLIILWDPATGQNTATLQGHTNTVTSLAFHPDGKTLASAGSDGKIMLWNVQAK